MSKRKTIEVPPEVIAIMRECEELQSLLLMKHADYGGSVYKNPVLKPALSCDDALWVRMSDKIERIASLLGGKPDRTGESLRDSVRDLAGYLVLWLAMPEQRKDT